jgi:hypothetical protein
MVGWLRSEVEEGQCPMLLVPLARPRSAPAWLRPEASAPNTVPRASPAPCRGAPGSDQATVATEAAAQSTSGLRVRGGGTAPHGRPSGLACSRRIPFVHAALGPQTSTTSCHAGKAEPMTRRTSRRFVTPATRARRTSMTAGSETKLFNRFVAGRAVEISGKLWGARPEGVPDAHRREMKVSVI